jgi:hypothetical protein
MSVSTRRAFVSMILAGAGVLAVHAVVTPKAAEEDRPRDPWHGKTRWIGHC